MESKLKRYLKPEEEEALDRKRCRDTHNSGSMGGVYWDVIQDENGKERVRVYGPDGKELNLYPVPEDAADAPE
ncbi:MAG: hypothetical protein V3V26_02230 [Candidatus Aenigmarchaeota archaeon]